MNPQEQAKFDSDRKILDDALEVYMDADSDNLEKFLNATKELPPAGKAMGALFIANHIEFTASLLRGIAKPTIPPEMIALVDTTLRAKNIAQVAEKITKMDKEVSDDAA